MKKLSWITWSRRSLLVLALPLLAFSFSLAFLPRTAPAQTAQAASPKPAIPLAVVVVGRDSELDRAVELVRAGAFDFLEHPFSDRRLRSVVRRAIGAPV